MKNIVYNCDCMEYMKTVENNYFELAIVDPPYILQGNGYQSTSKNFIGKQENCKASFQIDKCRNKNTFGKRPTQKYFNELFRISKNQIIWGMQYFLKYLYSMQCVVVWDKMLGDGMRFSDCEIAWTSFKTKVKKIMMRSAHMQKDFIIHPTQKPLALYRWLLQNYAKKGDKIFDSHLGSGSSRIACYELGFDFIGCEIDKDYYEAQEERFAIIKNKIDGKFFYDKKEKNLFNIE